jgi:hypothetical protein
VAGGGAAGVRCVLGGSTKFYLGVAYLCEKRGWLLSAVCVLLKVTLILLYFFTFNF